MSDNTGHAEHWTATEARKEHDADVARIATLKIKKQMLNWMDQLEYYINSRESGETHQSAWNYLKRKVTSINEEIPK
jgi:hypothetical protein